jgi:hypothetical protein
MSLRLFREIISQLDAVSCAVSFISVLIVQCCGRANDVAIFVGLRVVDIDEHLCFVNAFCNSTISRFKAIFSFLKSNPQKIRIKNYKCKKKRIYTLFLPLWPFVCFPGF